jgi:hypothetical protein
MNTVWPNEALERTPKLLTHSLPVISTSGLPIYVAPLPAGSIQRGCHSTLLAYLFDS